LKHIYKKIKLFIPALLGMKLWRWNYST